MTLCAGLGNGSAKPPVDIRNQGGRIELERTEFVLATVLRTQIETFSEHFQAKIGHMQIQIFVWIII